MDETQEHPGTPSPRMPSANFITRRTQAIRQFYRDVKLEMKRVTWPARQEVYATTMVTVFVVFFFGFFLFGTNWVLSYLVKELVAFLSK